MPCMSNLSRQLSEFARPRYIWRAISNPKEILQGFRSIRRSYRKDRLDYETERQERPARLATLLDEDIDSLESYSEELFSNPHLQIVEERFQRLESSNTDSGTSSEIDSQTLFIATRALKPNIVVETGVLHGAFDAHILAALEANGKGTLTSLDLPGQPSEEFEYGYLIPNEIRDRWDLRLGDAKEILDDVLEEVGPVDMFVHDSSHYPDHMRFEYETAYPHIREGGVLASHDILLASTFSDFCEEMGMDHVTIANTGIAVKS